MDLAALRRWWPLAAVTALLALAALAAAHSTPQFDRTEPAVDVRPELADDYPPPAGDPPPARDVAAGDAGLPDWLGGVLLGLLAVTLFGIIVAVLWTLLRDYFRRRTPAGSAARSGPGRVSATDAVVAALDAGLEDLSDGDRDPRRAVIACWVRLEEAAAAAGTPRQLGDTSADLVGRLLREQRVSADVLAGFADVYREARYATHTVDERMRGQARAALHRLRAELTATPGGPPATAATAGAPPTVARAGRPATAAGADRNPTP